MTEAEITTQLLGYINEHFLDDDPTSDLNERTPLLDWGVLNSLNTAQLLVFIRDELGYDVPPARVSARNFANVHAISTMLCNGLVAAKAQE